MNGILAQSRAKYQNQFIEGYGMPFINGERPHILRETDEKLVESAINIINENEDCEVEIYEIIED